MIDDKSAIREAFNQDFSRLDIANDHELLNNLFGSEPLFDHNLNGPSFVIQCKFQLPILENIKHYPLVSMCCRNLSQIA
jgi:hypothetical protein